MWTEPGRIGWNSLWSLEPSQIPAPIYIILLPKITWTLALEPFDMSLMSGPWCEPPKIHAQGTCTSECLCPMLIIIPSRKPYCQPATKLYNKLIFELSWTRQVFDCNSNVLQGMGLHGHRLLQTLSDHMAIWPAFIWSTGSVYTPYNHSVKPKRPCTL